MSLHTQIARRCFSKDQTFMAKRKLNIVILAIVVGVLASAIFVGMVFLAQQAA